MSIHLMDCVCVGITNENSKLLILPIDIDACKLTNHDLWFVLCIESSVNHLSLHTRAGSKSLEVSHHSIEIRTIVNFGHGHVLQSREFNRDASVETALVSDVIGPLSVKGNRIQEVLSIDER